MFPELIGENLEGETAPFCFPTNFGIEIRPAPMVYIPDLVAKLFSCWNKTRGKTLVDLFQSNKHLHILYLHTVESKHAYA